MNLKAIVLGTIWFLMGHLQQVEHFIAAGTILVGIGISYRDPEEED